MKLSAPVAELSRVRSPSSQLPQPQTVFANTQASAKKGFFSGVWGGCEAEKFLKNTEGSCKLNELVSVAANNRLHRNIEDVENLNEPEEARLMAGFFRSTRLQRNKQVQKRNLSAIAHQIYKKRTFTRPNSQKRTRNVFTRLNNYSRTRSADGFDGSTARTGQNGKLSHQKTVNGTRNFFAGREALAGCRGAALTRW